MTLLIQRILLIILQQINMRHLFFFSLLLILSSGHAISQEKHPFDIEKVPVYPGCVGNNNEELKQCLMSKIMAHIGDNFNTDISSGSDLEGRQRIEVLFVISSEGKVAQVEATGPHPSLEAEAVRVVESLPQMEAGEQEGKKVTIQYALPIIFHVK